MKVSNLISNEAGFRRQEDGRLSSTRAYKQVAKDKLDLNKTRVFLAMAKGYMTWGGQPQGCLGRAPTLGHVPNGP